MIVQAISSADETWHATAGPGFTLCTPGMYQIPSTDVARAQKYDV
jgi:hypothetical protein